MKTIDQNTIDLINSRSFNLGVLLRFDLPSGVYAFWNGFEPITVDGQLYDPIGGAFSVGPISGGKDGAVQTVEIILNPLDRTVANSLYNEQWHRKPCTISRCFINDDGVIQSVHNWFTGIIDQIEDVDLVGENEGAELRASITSHNWETQRSGSRTRSDTDQTLFHPGDRFYQYNSSVAVTPIWWGRKGPETPGTGAPTLQELRSGQYGSGGK